MSKVIEFNILGLESKIIEAKHAIMDFNNYCDNNIVLYIPEFMQQFIMRNYNLFLDKQTEMKTLFGMEVLNGYENAIVVAHKESVIRNIPVIKITFN